MKRFLLTLSIFFLAAISSYAAELTGDWKGTIKAPNGELEVTYKFKEDGERLIGKVVTSYGELYLIDGKITADDSFTFKLEIEENILELNGKIEGDAIVMKTNYQGSELQHTIKRVAK